MTLDEMQRAGALSGFLAFLNANKVTRIGMEGSGQGCLVPDEVLVVVVRAVRSYIEAELAKLGLKEPS
jgi:hypothetical protein